MSGTDGQRPGLAECRAEIDRIDREMALLFERRMAVAEHVGVYKKERGLAVRVPDRERELLEKNLNRLQNPALAPLYTEFLQNVVGLSCRVQEEILGTDAETPRDAGPPRFSAAPVVRRGALEDIGSVFGLNNRKVLVVTDDGVPPRYAETVVARSAEARVFRIPAGERSKCLDCYAEVLGALFDGEFTRADCVVAVGGGVVGDLAGFAAATYLRGIDFYNVPTTLLAQLDSSVGGKTAVDFRGVKNGVGVFRAPRGVLVDPDTLDTLDPRQLRSGLAEAVKMAVTGDAELFGLLERSADISADLETVVRRSLDYKRSVVERDAEEAGLRRVLNFGHTLGHAVESACGGALLHGECVAAGMLPFSGPRVRGRLASVLRKYGLPTEIPVASERLAPFLLHDKKRAGETVTTVFSDDIGTFRFRALRPEEILEAASGFVAPGV